MDAGKVRAVRKKLGMSQMDFADAIRVSQGAVSSWERVKSRSKPSPENVEQIIRLEEEFDRQQEDRVLTVGDVKNAIAQFSLTELIEINFFVSEKVQKNFLKFERCVSKSTSMTTQIANLISQCKQQRQWSEIDIEIRIRERREASDLAGAEDKISDKEWEKIEQGKRHPTREQLDFLRAVLDPIPHIFSQNQWINAWEQDTKESYYNENSSDNSEEENGSLNGSNAK